MASWATKRKLTYASSIIIFLVIVTVVPFFYFFYKAPTCFDGKQNGDELGLDCGGSCVKLCQSSFLPPRIEWGGAKLERLNDSLYNAGAYIVNPNLNGGALNVPYKISLYDAKGLLIIERQGSVTLYPRRNSLAFERSINTEKRIPAKATFEFLSSPQWFKAEDNLSGISVIDKRYNEDENGSSLEVVLENTNLLPFNNIEVGVVLFDINGNAIGFSETKVDEIAGRNAREVAPYTWPVNRDGQVTSIEILPIITPIPKD